MIFTIIKTYAIGLTVYWSFVLGAVMIFLLFVMPGGLVGGGRTVYGRIARRSHSRKSEAG
jgi:ABC-type branched-subunit amino acid transport system permease subunit